MALSDLCSDYLNQGKLEENKERNIIEFCEAPWGLSLGSGVEVPPLFPVQKFMLKAYYNIPLADDEKNIIIKDKFNEKERFRFSEMGYLDYLWNEGRINIKEVTGNPDDVRPNLLLVIGRRGLKTSTISLIVSYETYKLLRKVSPQQYYKIMPDDEIRVSCIATNQEQAAELFRRITGHLERADFFKRYRSKPTLNFMQLASERDIEQYGATGGRPSIRIVASPCSGRGLRGHNNIIAVLDEMAYFFESESSVDRSDKTIYDAVTPSVAKFNSPSKEPHGKVISISSPGSRSGKFYDLYQRSMEADCNDLLMIQAPTWEVDYTLAPKFLRAKYSENPTTFMSEFGAQFSDRISAWIENEQILRMNIIPDLKLKTSSFERIPHFMGIDVGLKNDGTAIVICHIVRKDTPSGPKDFIEIDCTDVRYAPEEDKEYFRPEEMAEWIASYMDKFFVVQGLADQVYGLSIIPALEDKGHKQFTAARPSSDFTSKIFQNLMSKMLDGSLRIPSAPEHLEEGRRTTDIPLVSEMLRLQATIHSKYLIDVKAPEIKGVHDDLSDALARAVYLATEYMGKGGSALQQHALTSTANNATYKKYYRQQKRGVIYTQRPSSTLQTEMSKSRQPGLRSNIRPSSGWR